MTGKIIRKNLLQAVAGLFIGTVTLAWAPVAWGQGVSPAPLQVQEAPPRSMDRSLPGKRQGVLTRAKDGTVTIERSVYAFAADAVIQAQSGRPFQANSLRLDGVEYRVDYWMGTDSADRQIVQMVIYFPH